MRPDRNPSQSAPVFPSIEAAWFATVAQMQPNGSHPLWVAEVLRAVDRLYRLRRLDLLHARILRFWGMRGRAPLPSRPRERSDWQIWREAMDRLDGPLRRSGLVQGAMLADEEVSPDVADQAAAPLTTTRCLPRPASVIS